MRQRGGVREGIAVRAGLVEAVHVRRAEEGLRPAAPREMYRDLRPGGRLLGAGFRPPNSRLGRRLVHGASDDAMAQNRVGLWDDFVADAGFEMCGHGDVQPWLRYVQGTWQRVQSTSWREATAMTTSADRGLGDVLAVLRQGAHGLR